MKVFGPVLTMDTKYNKDKEKGRKASLIIIPT